jgi:uncharacterized protein YbjT (DUF2867 family)
MLKPRILATGATGKTGSLVVAELLKAGYPVRAMVHREDGRGERQGAEIAVADMSDVERVADALTDVHVPTIVRSPVRTVRDRSAQPGLQSRPLRP